MSLKRNLIRALDRPFGRPLLTALTSARARRLLDDRDVEVIYNDLWIHRLGQYFIPDSQRYEYYDQTIRHWANEISEFFKNAEDYWFGHYRPKVGDVIVDVGARRGEDVLPFTRHIGPTGKVLAIEAHPVSFQLLEKFCSLNDLTNVRRFHMALMD